jgi:hypothetical protein
LDSSTSGSDIDAGFAKPCGVGPSFGGYLSVVSTTCCTARGNDNEQCTSDDFALYVNSCPIVIGSIS